MLSAVDNQFITLIPFLCHIGAGNFIISLHLILVVINVITVGQNVDIRQSRCNSDSLEIILRTYIFEICNVTTRKIAEKIS